MINQFIKLWFVEVSRGYTLLMSVCPWLVAFVYCLKNGGNIFYGIISLIGLVCAHLGTNVFDDYIDHISGVPKQKCKTAYLDEKRTTINKILILAIIYFSIAAIIGFFFTFKFGLPIVVLVGLGGGICLLYPKLNFVCLGEIALGAAFGPLLFLGVSYVMLGQLSEVAFWVSFPVSAFIVGLLWTHALMDYDFDKESCKKTFCTVLGSKDNALLGLVILMAFGYTSCVILSVLNILPKLSLTVFVTLPLALKLIKELSLYNLSSKVSTFMRIFAISRNLSVLFNLIIVLSILFGK